MALFAVATPSQPIVAVAIAILLFFVTRPIIRRASQGADSEWVYKVLVASLVLHLLAVPLQIWVVDHFYNGIADWLHYDHQGAVLSQGFRHLDFSTASLKPKGLVGDGSISIITGAVFSIIGIDQLGAFFIFSWFAFLGLILFYKAFIITFGGAGHRRYGALLFFLPSLIFWTADVSKEAVMTLALGLIAYGGSKFLVHQRGGLIPILAGTGIAAMVRPNELLLAAAGMTIAIMILPAAQGRSMSGLTRVVSFVFLGAILLFAVYLTNHYLHVKTGSAALENIASNNRGHGSSISTYSSSPAAYPRDVYTVLFDPLPINAHGNGELLAAIENMVIIGVILCSLRQLRILIRASFARPYVLMCLIYSAGFFYAFAALGNLGLITRERTLLLPFMLVFLSIPRSPKGEEPQYEWELRRRDRRQFRESHRESFASSKGNVASARQLPPRPARPRASTRTSNLVAPVAGPDDSQNSEAPDE